MHLHHPKLGGSEVYSQWTNLNTTNNTPNDGFKSGIAANGDAVITQQENRDIVFRTGNADAVEGANLNNERMRIKGTTGANQGFVGINTTTPTNRVEINSGTANTSGLTFTNLTSAFNNILTLC